MTKLIALLMLMLLPPDAAVDLSGKWNFVWQTEGGERRSVLTFTAQGGSAPGKWKVDFPGAKSPLDAALDGNRLQVSGSLYSAEAGSTGAFQLKGTVDGKRIKGTASWDEHTMTFEASKAD